VGVLVYIYIVCVCVRAKIQAELRYIPASTDDRSEDQDLHPYKWLCVVPLRLYGGLKTLKKYNRGQQRWPKCNDFQISAVFIILYPRFFLFLFNIDL